MARPTAAQQLEPSGLEADWMLGVMQNWSLGRLQIFWGTYRGKLLLILMKISTGTVTISVYSALTCTEPWLHTIPRQKASRARAVLSGSESIAHLLPITSAFHLLRH